MFDNSFLLDPSKLCNEISLFDKGGIGPFGLFVLTNDVDGQEEHTAVYFRIYKSSGKYMALMCSDLRKYSFTTSYQIFLGFSSNISEI